MIWFRTNYLVLVLLGLLVARQTSSVDLTRPPSASKTSDKPAISDGCDRLTGGGIADGWPETADHKPRQITVKVVSATEMKPALGDEVEATVQLSNNDAVAISIPWSTDPNVIRQGQEPNSLEWDAGTFEFSLTGRQLQRGYISLKSLTGWLQSSKYVPGSRFTIQPGESVTAVVKFRVEDEFAIASFRLKEGEWQLSARWQQIGRVWSKKDCAVWNMYYHYDRYYQQRSIPLTIEVTTPSSAKANGPKSR
jgi:hypothetical protein